MTGTLLLLVLLQQPPLITWIGRVTAVNPSEIHASSGPQGTLTNLTITLAPGGKVWKKSTFQDFSAIRVGDEITIRGYRVATGEVQATQIYANITRVNGRVKSISGMRFDVEAFNEAAQPRGETITVSIDTQTVTCREQPFSIAEVQKGTEVEVIGLRLSNRQIAASRVDVYVNGRQVCK
jgi:hypothetical protein